MHRSVHVQRLVARPPRARPAARAPTPGRPRGTRGSAPIPTPCPRARRPARRARARRAARVAATARPPAGRCARARPARSGRRRAAPAARRGRRRARARRATMSGPRAQRVEVGVDLRRRQPASDGTTTQSKRPFASAGLSSSPRPVPIAVPPMSANGTSAPSRAASWCSCVAAEVGAPQRVARDQRGRGIRRPAAHAARDRDVLDDVEMHAAGVPDLLRDQPRGAQREVAVVGRHARHVDGAGDRHREVVGRLGPHVLVERDRLIGGRDIVIPVVLHVAHLEEEVQLARRPHVDAVGDDGVASQLRRLRPEVDVDAVRERVDLLELLGRERRARPARRCSRRAARGARRRSAPT